MQRNRESAHQSRQRKRMQMDEVEQRCEQLKQQNSQLNQLVGRLTAENMGLKQQLVNMCHETGRPLPPPPLSAMHPFAFGQMGLPMLVPAPKVGALCPCLCACQLDTDGVQSCCVQLLVHLCQNKHQLVHHCLALCSVCRIQGSLLCQGKYTQTAS